MFLVFFAFIQIKLHGYLRGFSELCFIKGKFDQSNDFSGQSRMD
jgi:hypothetical protein